MNFPDFVLPYQRPLLWYTPVSVFTQTLPLALAAAISWAEGAPLDFVAVLAAAALPDEGGGAGAVEVGLVGSAGCDVFELAPLEVDWALAKTGEIATASVTQKATIHRLILLQKKFIAPSSHELHHGPPGVLARPPQLYA